MTDITERNARREGRQAYLNGKGLIGNPYTKGSFEDASYVSGYEEEEGKDLENDDYIDDDDHGIGALS